VADQQTLNIAKRDGKYGKIKETFDEFDIQINNDIPTIDRKAFTAIESIFHHKKARGALVKLQKLSNLLCQ
jgi:hypothetical protein